MRRAGHYHSQRRLGRIPKTRMGARLAAPEAARAKMTTPKKAAKATTERYYAVRIGDPRTHDPYFMLDDSKPDGKMLPAIFESRAQAEAARPKRSSTKAVRVWITTRKP